MRKHRINDPRNRGCQDDIAANRATRASGCVERSYDLRPYYMRGMCTLIGRYRSYDVDQS